MALAVVCLSAGLLPSQRISAESVCYIEGCPDGQPPVITDQPDDVTIPVGGTATFTVTATNALGYDWYQGIAGDTRRPTVSGNTFTTLSLKVSTQYWVRVSNYEGYTDSQAVVAQIDPVSSPFPFCTSQQLSYDRATVPQTDGRFVTWFSYVQPNPGQWPSDPSTDLFVHDALTNKTEFVTRAYNEDMSLKISKSRIAWSKGIGPYSSDTYISNLLTGELTNLTEVADLAGFSGYRVYLVDDYILWTEDHYIRVYNLASGEKSEYVGEDFQFGPVLTVNNRYAILFSGITDNEYYAYDIVSNTLHTFTAHISPYGYTSTSDDGFVMELDDTYFVWHDIENGDINLLDLTSMEQANISNSPGMWKDEPSIDNGKVVWLSGDSPGNNNTGVWLYDIQTYIKTRLSHADGRVYSLARIDGNRVVWQSTGGGSGPQLHIFNLQMQSEEVIPIFESAQDLQISGQWVALSIGNSVYLYDGIAIHQIASPNPSMSYLHLQIVGNTILWRAHPTATDYGNLYYTYKFPFMSHCEGAAPVITDQPDNTLISTGDSVTLSVTATGDGSLGYQWYQVTSGDTSNPISGATSSNYTTPALTTLTNYWVRVNGTFGSVDSVTATIVNRDEWTPTWTPLPATATLTLTPTWTSMPETATSLPSMTSTGVPPTEATLVPTATTPPTVSLLVNGGFEIDSDNDKLPDGWTAKKTNADKADKLKCDKDDKLIAHSAPCAFAFSGNPDGSTSTLSQSIDPAALYDGGMLTLSAWVDPKSAPVGTKFAQAKLSFSDGSSTKLKLSLPNANGYIQQTDTATLDLTGKTVMSAKLDLKYDQPGGKLYVDDVMLTIAHGAARFGLP